MTDVALGTHDLNSGTRVYLDLGQKPLHVEDLFT